MSTIQIHGRKPYEDLPAYCRCFDVGLIPFKINELTKAVNPIKLREYLAAGLPVVSTPLPEVAAYDGLVGIAHTPDETVAALEHCLAADPDQRMERSHGVADETWHGKLNAIEKALNDTTGR
ncbi:MAG TPA: glycosyltransferase [Phycisphaerae bacterium]|nr:glycosyltransferase [Phycisphaerae bacterium]